MAAYVKCWRALLLCQFHSLEKTKNKKVLKKTLA